MENYENKVSENTSQDIAPAAGPTVVKTGVGKLWCFDWMRSIIFAICAVMFILAFFVRIVNVDGDSMNMTLLDGDKLVVTGFMYTPTDGDIVIIRRGQHLDEPIVKRVIATEGQKLRIDFENQAVFVDDKKLDEPYVSSKLVKGTAEIPSVIPEGKVFVMGDNRKVSLDSRFYEVGLIDEEEVIGKVQFRLFPIEHFQYVG